MIDHFGVVVEIRPRGAQAQVGELHAGIARGVAVAVNGGRAFVGEAKLQIAIGMEQKANLSVPAHATGVEVEEGLDAF